MEKDAKKINNMNIDQQIQAFENKIFHLEQMKQSWHLRSAGPDQNVSQPNVGSQYIDEIEKNLDESYREITILKIRKMMGY
jgi:hypothetical protein